MVCWVSIAEEFVGRTPTDNNPNEVHQILGVMVSEIADPHRTHCTIEQFTTAYQTLEVMVSEIIHLYMCHMTNPPSGWIIHGKRNDLLVRRTKHSFRSKCFEILGRQL